MKKLKQSHKTDHIGSREKSTGKRLDSGQFLQPLRGLIKHHPSKGYHWVRNKINAIKRERKYRKRLKELRKKDPFIYK